MSASVGGGHDGAAFELARRLREAGWQVTLRDFLAAQPAGLGWLTRRVYFWQIRWAPSSYGALLQLLSRPGWPLRIALWMGRVGSRRVRSWAAGTDLIVSTHPMASQAVGALRLRGQVAAPVVTFLTDLSVHRLWVADGVDVHVALHAVSARQVHDIDPATRVVVCSPLVRPEYAGAADPARRAAARARYGLAADDVIALIVSGSCGVGDVEQTVQLLADSGQVRPLVVCGRNEQLRARLTGDPRVTAIGWTDNMPEVIAAADVMVQNAGGLSSLEGLAAGLSVISHNCLSGHGEANAISLAEAGLARHACGHDLVGEIMAIVAEPAREPQRAMFAAPDPAMVVQAVASALAPTPAALTAGRRLQRRAGTAVAALAATAWLATAGVGVATASGFAVGKLPTTSTHRAVVIINDARNGLQGVSVAQLQELRACVAVGSAPHPGTATGTARFAAAGVPVLSTRPSRINDGRRAGSAHDRNGRPIVLLEHSNALTLAESRLHGYDPIVAKHITMSGEVPVLHPGEIVVLDASGATPADVEGRLELVESRLAADGLEPVAVNEIGLK